ncbi:MAG: mannose-6-phosphate isomerase, class I [Desulfobacterales bacterium]|nr:mannose-6-phosphate isomerase, class I [Desulfobacterales bacterium]
MNRIGLLKNIVKEYSWGSYTAIPKLLGKKPPYDKPQAELWMGAHPSGYSMIRTEGGWESLSGLIKKYPVEILGENCAKKYGGELPFLFKVIAASGPLSIQAHPNRTMAKKGFKRENRLGIPLDSSGRNYRDNNHKPECLCAISGFEALCGFRGVSETVRLLKKTCPGTLKKQINELKNNTNPSGLKSFFTSIMTMDSDRKKSIVSEAFRNAGIFADENPAFKWVSVIAGKYPSDIGAIAPLFLNYVHLEPGQAMFIQTGQLHAYLEGVALELMADSDNVIRGGLTPKHVDVQELLNIVKFKQLKTGIIFPEKNRNESIYKTPAGEFVLSAINVTNSETYISPGKRSIEIILCIEGRAVITGSEDDKFNMTKGKSVIIPASVKKYNISGKATLYKAAVPL